MVVGVVVQEGRVPAEGKEGDTDDEGGPWGVLGSAAVWATGQRDGRKGRPAGVRVVGRIGAERIV